MHFSLGKIGLLLRCLPRLLVKFAATWALNFWQPCVFKLLHLEIYKFCFQMHATGMYAGLKEKKTWRAWKCVWNWAKSLQNRLEINKSVGLYTSWEEKFLQKQENDIPDWCKNRINWWNMICFRENVIVTCKILSFCVV